VDGAALGKDGIAAKVGNTVFSEIVFVSALFFAFLLEFRFGSGIELPASVSL
jgi:hypothetical protein